MTRRASPSTVVLGLLLLTCGCTDAPATLRVELYTDLVSGVEYDRVVVTNLSAGTIIVDEPPAPAGARFVETPLQLDGEIAAGEHLVAFELRREGRGVMSAEALVQVRGVTGVIVALLRTCLDVECDASRPNCLNGTCVRRGCTTGAEDACDEAPSCDACPPPASECLEQVCLLDNLCSEAMVPGACDPDQYCAETGCRPIESEPPDGGVADAAPIDATTTDSGPEDAGADAEIPDASGIGSGTRIDDVRAISADGIDVLEVCCGFVVRFEVGTPAQITYRVDDNLVDQVGHQVSRGILRFTRGVGIEPSAPIEIVVRLPTPPMRLVGISNGIVAAFDASGAGSLLDVDLTGGASATLPALVADDLVGYLNGGATLNILGGAVDAQIVEVFGGSLYTADAMSSVDAEIVVSEMSIARVHASGTLSAIGTSSGQILYRGMPTVTTSLDNGATATPLD